MWFGKKNKTVDLTDNYARQKDRLQNLKEGIKQNAEENSSGAGNFNFLANLASSSQSQAYSDSGEESSDERKRKLAQRLMDLTEKIEELSTQIYHLQQRVELLEKKSRAGLE
ncbi:MAG TPA: hypothetical protein VMC07_00965 [Candidatus Omnitrophota bacterium]|nr:hypothetical protein [Candidatus Omnitrophota bacterium]